MTGSGRTCSGAVKGMVANMTIDIKNTFNRLNSFKFLTLWALPSLLSIPIKEEI